MSGRGELQTSIAVAAGGALGASARWGVGEAVAPAGAGGFPWHTFGINVLGCLLIGLTATRIRRGTTAWAFVATGLLGGFTTMSSFAVELNDLAEADASSTLVVYLVATLGAGFVALAAAEALGGPIDDSAAGTEGIE